MKMRGWRAWLKDGSCIRSVDSTFADLPRKGIVLIKAYFDPPYKATMEYDWWLYIPETDEIVGIDEQTQDYGQEKKKYPTAIVRRGMYLPDREYFPIRARSYEYKDP